MKLLIGIFVLFFFQSTAQDPLATGSFPDELTVAKTPSHKRIAGTKIYAIMPDSYVEHRQKNLYHDSKENIYGIEFGNHTEISDLSWTEIKESIDKREVIIGQYIEVFKEVEINGYEGRYIEYFNKDLGSYQIRIVFGNDNFCASVTGITMPNTNEAAKQEINEVLMSIYYENEFDLNEFEFDHEITGLQLVKNSGYKKYHYTENEKVNEFITYVDIIVYKDSITDTYLENIRSSKIDLGTYKINKRDFKEIKYGSNIALIKEYEIVNKGKEGIYFSAFIHNGSKGLWITSRAYRDWRVFRKKFIKSLISIAFK